MARSRTTTATAATVGLTTPASPIRRRTRRRSSSTLDDYAAAYSAQDAAALAALFTDDVFRRGIGAGGRCTETRGIDDVIPTYEAQFTSGTGTYSLTDTSEGVIDLNGDTAGSTPATRSAPALRADLIRPRALGVRVADLADLRELLRELSSPRPWFADSEGPRGLTPRPLERIDV